ncbi:MAG: hypothetical protein O7E54_09495 [Planctomycetota bacterium]|nr:hypothetical protein [Planctomycetota bacterium]
MATTPQERVIGGGLLFLGIAIVLLLIYFFGFKGGPTTAEAKEQLFSDLFPSYETALERREYSKARKLAGEINNILTRTGSGPLKETILGEATTNPQYKRFNRLMGKGTFGKNVDNLWDFDGKWYEPATCRDLQALRHTVDDLIAGSMRDVRDAAKELAAAIEEARIGSQKPLTLPPTKLPDGALPPTEVAARQFAPFGLPAKELRAALQTKDTGGGKARSARLRWDRDVVKSPLGSNLEKIAKHSAALREAAVDVPRLERALAERPKAKQRVAFYLKRAALALAPETEPTKRNSYENGSSIATLLMQYHKILEAKLGGLPELSQAVVMPFRK